MTDTAFYRFIDAKKYIYEPKKGLFISYGVNGKETERHLCGSYKEANNYLEILYPGREFENWRAKDETN